MKALSNIANLILVRDNLNSILNGFGKLSKEDKTNIQQKLDLFNKVILEQSLKLDVSDIEEKQIPITRGFTVSSTEDTEVVMKKFMQPEVLVKADVPISQTRTYDYRGISSGPITITQQTPTTAASPFGMTVDDACIITEEPVVSHNILSIHDNLIISNETKSE
jgi:hypothetical protein